MTVDPKTAHPTPPFDQDKVAVPGHTGEMDPKPDHGEESYKGSGKLEGKEAIITGADSGIGRAVAIAFAREGADVLISYLDEDDDAQETARWSKGRSQAPSSSLATSRSRRIAARWSSGRSRSSASSTSSSTTPPSRRSHE